MQPTNNIEIGLAPVSKPTKRSSQSDATRQTSLNNLLGWAVLFLVVVAPLPFGSNRPIFWAAWAVYVGFVGMVYFVGLARTGERLRFRPGNMSIAIGLFVATCAYLLFQCIPLGQVPVPVAGEIPLAARSLSIAPNMTVLMLLRQLTFGVLFMLTLQISVNDKRRTTFLHIILMSVIAYGVYGLVSLQAGDTILGLQKWAYLGSATGTFINRNSFATYLGFGALIALANACGTIVRQAERHKHDGRIQNGVSTILLYLIAYAFLVGVVIATQSRMGLFATGMGSLALLIMTVSTVRGAKLAIYLIPAVLVILGGGLFLYGGGLFERAGTVEFSADVRLNLYRQVLELIALRPWTGFGGGSFELAFPLVHMPPVSPDVIWSKAHNTYLTLWSELGLIFGTLPMLAIAFVAFRLLGNLRRGRGSWTTQAMGVGVIVLGAVHSLADFSLEIEADTFLFLVLIAAAVATTQTFSRATS